jgi:arylsulfatase A-like enzyme
MVEHDMHVGELLDLLDELGIADNTIVMYSTDNGPHYNTWPDAGTTPSAARRTPTGRAPTACPRSSAGPASSPPAHTVNGIVAHEDWLPTFAAAAGDPDIKEDLLDGYQAPHRSHLQEPPRRLQQYLAPYAHGRDRGVAPQGVLVLQRRRRLVAIRYGDWKAVFLENRVEATSRSGANPFTPLRVPLLFNLRRDPFEKCPAQLEHVQRLVPRPPYIIVPMQQTWPGSSRRPSASTRRSQKAAFNLEKVMEMLERAPVPTDADPNTLRPPPSGARRISPNHFWRRRCFDIECSPRSHSRRCC